MSARSAPPAGWRANLQSVVSAVAIALLARGFLVEAFKIPSGSMIPTLAIGDQIFVNKVHYGIRIPFTTWRLATFAVPKAGEVVVFVAPMPPHEDFIKRIVGLPGDEVALRGGQVFINGRALIQVPKGEVTVTDWDSGTGAWFEFQAEAFEERLGAARYTVLRDRSRPHPDFGPVKIPEGFLLALGDNRDHSYDSRDWGLVPIANVVGRSTFVWWSWGRHGLAGSRLLTWVD